METIPPFREKEVDAKVEGVVPEVVTEPEIPSEQSLPVPHGPLRQEKPSLWKRISMRRRPEGGANGLLMGEELGSRLALVESRLEVLQESINTRFRQLEQRLDDIWEPEEQLSHLIDIQEKLDSLVGSQKASLEAARRARKRSTAAAIIATIAAAGGATAAAFSYLDFMS